MKKIKNWKVVLLLGSMVLVLATVGCSPKNNASGVGYKDGVFTGEAEGERWVGSSTVTLTIKDGKVADVEILETNNAGDEKKPEEHLVCFDGGKVPLLSDAYPDLISQVTAKNDWDIDGFTGATESATAFKEAVKAALAKAI